MYFTYTERGREGGEWFRFTFYSLKCKLQSITLEYMTIKAVNMKLL